ncbi:uncharacterized protein [Littorina saxatilis]|uniref:uncharacterized protein n=1 Tax=Littorina saxatilis TaxID=31220 RepID=UPI0038B4F275
MADKNSKSKGKLVSLLSSPGKEKDKDKSKSKSKTRASVTSSQATSLILVTDPVTKKTERVSLDSTSPSPVFPTQERSTSPLSRSQTPRSSESVSREEVLAMFATLKHDLVALHSAERPVAPLPPGVGGVASLSRLRPSATITSADLGPDFSGLVADFPAFSGGFAALAPPGSSASALGGVCGSPHLFGGSHLPAGPGYAFASPGSQTAPPRQYTVHHVAGALGSGEARQPAPLGSVSAVPASGGQAAASCLSSSGLQDSVGGHRPVALGPAAAVPGSSSQGVGSSGCPSGLPVGPARGLSSSTSGCAVAGTSGGGQRASGSGGSVPAIPSLVTHRLPAPTSGSAAAVPVVGGAVGGQFAALPSIVQPTLATSASVDGWVSGLPDPPSDGDQEGFGEEQEGDEDCSESVTPLRIPNKLGPTLELAAEITSRYFPEGVSADSTVVAPPPSALADFAGAGDTKAKFRFVESPSVPFVMAQVLADANTPYPLLAAHGEAPPSAQPWLTSAQAGGGLPANSRRSRLPSRPHSLLSSFSLPTAPLPVTPELARLRQDGYSRDRTSVCTEQSLLGLEESGRSSLELTSLAETLIRSLTRAIASSIEPFRFRDDAIEADAAMLLAALAKVTDSQMTLAARLYSQVVFWRREAFLNGSRLTDKATIDSLRVSPFSEGALLGSRSLDALRQQTEETRDQHVVQLTELALKQHSNKPRSSASAPDSSSGQQSSRAGRGGSRSRPYQRKPSFGKRGSGRKPNPQ